MAAVVVVVFVVVRIKVVEIVVMGGFSLRSEFVVKLVVGHIEQALALAL